MACGQWHECRIRNISAGGAKLQSDSVSLEQGMEILLEIGNFGQFGGTVTWQSGEELGIKFTHDPAEMSEVAMGLALYG